MDLQNQLVIDDLNYYKFIGTQVVDGQKKGKGLIPRDFSKNPVGSYKSSKPFDPDEIPIIPREEWSERIEEGYSKSQFINEIRERNNIKVLDQNGQGYCWAYSGTMCLMMARLMANQPYVRLSAHSVAWTIKDGRDQGGWGCQGLDFIQDRGVMPVDVWPEQSMNGRTYNTPENWEKAEPFKATENWMDLNPRQYDRDMTFDQVMTCLLCNIPVIGDFNWWGHSVCLANPVEIDKRKSLMDPDRWGTGTPNSWGPNWGTNGYGILKGRKGIPDGGAAVRVASGD